MTLNQKDAKDTKEQVKAQSLSSREEESWSQELTESKYDEEVLSRLQQGEAEAEGEPVADRSAETESPTTGEQETNEAGEKKRPSLFKRFWLEVWSFVKVFCVVFCLFLLCNYFLVQQNLVEGSSMSPTLSSGDRILVNRLSTWLQQDFARGDIVTIHGSDITQGQYEDLIKRVVALPGEEVLIDQGQVYINGFKLAEPYLAPDVVTRSLTGISRWQLGPDEYFVMGDNREHSADSRIFGPIHKKAIMGYLLVRVYPFDAIGRVDVNWSRPTLED